MLLYEKNQLQGCISASHDATSPLLIIFPISVCAYVFYSLHNVEIIFFFLLQSQLLLCNLKCETQYKALNIFMVFLSESNNAGILKYYICPLGVHLGNTLRQLFSAVQVLVPIHLYWERLVYQKQNFHKIIRFCC